MNIKNFEDNIDEKILDRGSDYYTDGNIIEVHEQEDNEYIFQIEGNGNYEVIVQVSKGGKILYSECDCPYDFGPICKHEVAAYFELRDIINNKNNNAIGRKDVVKKLGVKDVLNNLSKEELVAIIVDITKEDKTLKEKLIVRYSKGNDEEEIKNCKALIESIVRKYTKAEGFIRYREGYAFVSEMECILDKVQETENILLSLDIAFLLLNEAIRAFQYADDSHGEIGCLVENTIGIIEEIASNSAELDINLRKEIFYKLIKQSEDRIFREWGEYKLGILRICTEFIDIGVLRERLIAEIKNLIKINSNDYYEKYTNEQLLEILLAIIKEYGAECEVNEFIENNLNFTSFRELLIEKYISKNNYEKVIELALEGEKKDKDFAGLIIKWKKLRYDAYKKLSLKVEQERLGKDLLFDGNFQYYNDLKELNIKDKVSFYNNLKNELKNNKGGCKRSIYLELIETENDLNEIMEFVRKNPMNIEDYAEKLAEKFKDEVIELYGVYIKSIASCASNRKNYQGVCQILNRYKKIAGKEK